MSLPGCQRRVLDHIEGALQASDPHLAAMYAVFTRLNAGAAEPVGAEPLTRRWPPHRRAAVFATVLVPVMFAIIVIGALLSGSARGATTCGVGPSASRGMPWVNRPSCAVRKTTEVKASDRVVHGQDAGPARRPPGRQRAGHPPASTGRRAPALSSRAC